MRLAASALVLASLIWVIATGLAPAMMGSPSRPAQRIAAAIYTAGGFVCHQRPERSFAAAGRPWAVCARCTGLYASAVIGGLLALLFGAVPPDRTTTRVTLAIVSLPTAITWAGEFAAVMHPSNTMRALCSLPLGAVAAWVVVTTLQSRPVTAERPHGV